MLYTGLKLFSNRFCTGLGIGGMSTAGICYISETIKNNIRGIVVSMSTGLITLGKFYIY